MGASLDEITTDDRSYGAKGMTLRNYEVEHIGPFVVYMLPLVATARGRPHGHHRGKVRPRDELVQGLLLVKDKEAINNKWALKGELKKVT